MECPSTTRSDLSSSGTRRRRADRRRRSRGGPVYQYDRLFIAGEWAVPSTTGVIEVVSPSSEEVIGVVPEGTPADMDRAVQAARDAFDHGKWRWMDVEERAQVLERAADLLEARSEEVARMITDEMGTPISYATSAQVPGPIFMLRMNARWAREFAFEEPMEDGGRRSLVVHEPVGVVAAIVPWNVPLTIAVGKIAPALVVGCSVVLKPADRKSTRLNSSHT